MKIGNILVRMNTDTTKMNTYYILFLILILVKKIHILVNLTFISADLYKIFGKNNQNYDSIIHIYGEIGQSSVQNGHLLFFILDSYLVKKIP